MGKVYLINAWGTDKYKIGITKKDVEKRIKQLQTGSGDELILVNHYETENYRKLEGWMHRKYGQSKMKGEWFELTDEQVLNFIDECKKADDTIGLLLRENPFYN